MTWFELIRLIFLEKEVFRHFLLKVINLLKRTIITKAILFVLN